MKFLKILTIFFGVIATVIIVGLGIAFTNPGFLLIEKNIRFAIDKIDAFDEYSFDSFVIEHNYEKWNQRRFDIVISSFCFKKAAPSFKVESCLDELSLDLRLKFFPLIEIEYLSELDAVFTHLVLESLPLTEEENQEKNDESEDSGAIDLQSNIGLIENKWIPNSSFRINTLRYISGENVLESPIFVTKRNGIVSGEFFDFHLIANKDLVSLQGPDSYSIPLQPFTIEHFSFVMNTLENNTWNIDFKVSVKKIKIGLNGFIPNKLSLAESELLKNFEGLKLSVEGTDLSDFENEISFLDKKSLSKTKFKSLFTYQSNAVGGQLEGLLDLSFQNNSLTFRSKTSIPALGDLINNSGQAQAELLSSTMIEFELDRKKHEWNQLKNLDLLPAPLNAMDGKIKIKLWGEKNPNQKGIVLLNGEALVDFESAEQDFKFNLKASIPYNFSMKEIGTIGTRLEVGKIRLSLPRVSTTSMPPQVIPDQRFILKQAPKKEESDEALKLNFEFVTKESRPLEIASNLLDEPLRLVVNLSVLESELNHGTIKLLPLSTTFFRRPILVKDLVLKLAKDKEPYLTGIVEFLLPEYKVSLNLEGPIQSVRSYFTSDPPLQLDDIYAVLLFGRPMTDLDAQAKSDAQRSAQVLSQSILSLTTLYFFAGSPVESLGYNPDKAEVSAQFGLSRNSSLRVSSQAQGERSAGVRRNLGRGWYLDTSVQQNSSQGTSGQAILLERIIAY